MMALAERLAAVRYDALWPSRTPAEREFAINQMVFFLSVVERAGLTVVEAEDGR